MFIVIVIIVLLSFHKFVSADGTIAMCWKIYQSRQYKLQGYSGHPMANGSNVGFLPS